MLSIHYVGNIPSKLPPISACGDIALLLRSMACMEPEELEHSDTLPAFSEDMDMTPTQMKRSYPAPLVAGKLLENSADLPETFPVSLPWPYRVPDEVFHSDTRAFLEGVRDKGVAGVRIPIAKLLSIAEDESAAEGEIADDVMVGLVAAYYCSFDERFQAVFYPSAYSNHASRDARLLECSSALADGMAATGVSSLSSTAAWTAMMMYGTVPVPSVLRHYYDASGLRTGLNDPASAPSVPADISGMAQLCREYLCEESPCEYDISDMLTQENLELTVADSIYLTSPASVEMLVANMLAGQDGPDDIEDGWLGYCNQISRDLEKDPAEVAYHPDTVSVEPPAQARLLELKGDFGGISPIRYAIATAAQAKFLGESLEGGAPSHVSLLPEDFAISQCISGRDFGFSWDCSDGDSEEIYERVRRSAQMGAYDVPDIPQRLFAANMLYDKRATISAADILSLVEEPSDKTALPIFAATIDPAAIHSGVEQDAGKMLTVAGAIFERMSMTMGMTEEDALRSYLTSLASVAAAYHLVDGGICDDADVWTGALTVPHFDPREHIVPSAAPRFPSRQIVLISNGGMDSNEVLEDLLGQAPMRGHRHRSPGKALEQYSTDMIAKAKAGEIGQGIVGRDETIELIETVLARRDKSNPLLLAPAGAGKTAIVEAIAARIASGESTQLVGKGLRALDLGALMGGAVTVSAITERVESVMEDAIESDTIVFIDEIHMVLSAGSGELNVGNIMKPFLAREGLHVIGATTEREYNYTIAKDRALSRRFSPMHLPALEFDEIASIVDAKASLYAAYHEVSYDAGIAKTVALLAEDYMADRESPDRELDIIDTAASVAIGKGDKTVGEEQIVAAVRLLTSNKGVKTRRDIASSLTHGNYSRESLAELFPDVAGQWAAKEAVARRIDESKLGLSARSKPRNIFMFVGESGVGKTYMATEMAPLLDVTAKDVLSMSLGDYQDRASHTRLLGAAPQYVGYQEGGELTNFVKGHPNGIIVLDELDKCHPDIMNVFLGVFDTGILKAADGSIVDCRSITFVCTANTGHGAEKKVSLGFATPEISAERERMAVMDALKTTFGEPLLSRIDEVVVFDELSADDIVDICRISYRKLADKLALRYAVELEEAYSEEKMVEEASRRFAEAAASTLDARSAWSQLEKEIVPAALGLLADGV